MGKGRGDVKTSVGKILREEVKKYFRKYKVLVSPSG
jgi:hypothetical protein